MSEIQVHRRIDSDQDWRDLADVFEIRNDTIYLNHGSFGISPRSVRAARRDWIDQLDGQPMDFYVRTFEPAIDAAKAKLADFIGTSPENLVFAENATFGMNVVADSFPLSSGDQVLINNHEYGAVHRIWRRACDRRNAELATATLPERFESYEQIVESIMSQVTPNTRLIVASHITSPTALVLPISEICEAAADRDIAVCIDGPHAPAQVPINLDALGCDFYTASCHKWLCATLGSGFLYVHPRWQELIEPQLKSWGRLLPNMPAKWFEEFLWSGTRDPSAYLSIPAAIEFFEQFGIEQFRARTRWLRARTSRQLSELTGRQPIAPVIDEWYAAMAHVPLPPGDWSQLQQWLWTEHSIEVPIVEFESDWYIRVSHHLYTTQSHVEQLMSALATAFKNK